MLTINKNRISTLLKVVSSETIAKLYIIIFNRKENISKLLARTTFFTVMQKKREDSLDGLGQWSLALRSPLAVPLKLLGRDSRRQS